MAELTERVSAALWYYVPHMQGQVFLFLTTPTNFGKQYFVTDVYFSNPPCSKKLYTWFLTTPTHFGKQHFVAGVYISNPPESEEVIYLVAISRIFAMFLNSSDLLAI